MIIQRKNEKKLVGIECFILQKKYIIEEEKTIAIILDRDRRLKNKRIDGYN